MPHVTLAREDALAVLTLDRPPANAMNLELLEEIVAAMEELEHDPPGALVVTGREGVFSAGVDLKAAPGYGPSEQCRMVQGINAMALGVYALPCPVVGAVTGHAIAGGFVLAVACDHLIASDSGRYGLTEIKVGVPFPQAAIGVVAAQLAPHAARRLALGSQLTDAQECLDLGVFDEVVDGARVLERAREVATELAAMPSEVYARTKRDLRAHNVEQMRRAAESDPLLERWVEDQSAG